LTIPTDSKPAAPGRPPAKAEVPPAKPAHGQQPPAKPAPHPAKAANQPVQKPAPSRPGQVVDYPGGTVRSAQPASVKPRHWGLGLSFMLLVVVPAIAAALYLYSYAADQYASRTSFSIRGNESAPALSILGALSQTVSVSGTDAEIIYDFVRSQQMVEAALDALPLEEIYNRSPNDIVFRLGENQPIEDITDYWNWMTTVSFDGASGIVHFEARAFDPESAQMIAAFVLAESTRIVNEISTQAREDAVAVARSVLEQAEDRLRNIRREIRVFRDTEQELDPTLNAQASMGLMAELQQQRAQAQVELDSYLSLVGPRGPRASALRQRISSLEQRINQERQRLGTGATGTTSSGDHRLFADLMGDYEELVVEREFAENAYVSALASFEQAQVEARRQTRFLSPHIRPPLSVEPQYPQRALLSVGIFILLTVAWAVLALIAYNVRDRR
jgi:capsular polysaccharide transport system permease protein